MSMEVLKFEGEYGWVIKVLESCENIEQLIVSQNVFNNFIKKWDKNISNKQKLRLNNSFEKLKWLQTSKLKKKVVN